MGRSLVTAMAEYPKVSLLYQKEIVTSSVQCMQMIGKLDRSGERLSRKLDEKLQKLKGRRLTDDKLVEEVNQLRRAVEIIAAKKVELAIKNYDFLDLNIKSIDAEMCILERLLRESGQEVPELPVSDFPSSGAADQTSSDHLHSTANTHHTSNHRHKSNKHCSSTTSSTTADVDNMNTINEPIYCICKRIAFGDMIACDNEDCPIEWFHYPCVNLTRKPKNSWICPLCSTKKKR